MMRICLTPWLALLLAGCTATRSNRLTLVGDSLEPFRAHFNAERARPRVLAFFSPT